MVSYPDQLINFRGRLAPQGDGAPKDLKHHIVTPIHQNTLSFASCTSCTTLLNSEECALSEKKKKKETHSCIIWHNGLINDQTMNMYGPPYPYSQVADASLKFFPACNTYKQTVWLNSTIFVRLTDNTDRHVPILTKGVGVRGPLSGILRAFMYDLPNADIALISIIH